MPIKGAFTPYETERFKKAIEYIRNNYHGNCSAELLAIEVGLDIKLLRLGIFMFTGLTIHNLIAKVRLKNALEDLANFNYTLKYIAKKHGFSSHSHFTWEVKRQTGKTPTQYRSQIIHSLESHKL